MVLCYYDGFLRSDEEDPVHIEGERRVVLIDDDVPLIYFLVR